jgi:hypothetical protein
MNHLEEGVLQLMYKVSRRKKKRAMMKDLNEANTPAISGLAAVTVDRGPVQPAYNECIEKKMKAKMANGMSRVDAFFSAAQECKRHQPLK